MLRKMPLWLQHLLIVLIVLACIAFVARQMVRTLRLKKSGLGACCAKGCDVSSAPESQPEGEKQAAQRIVFMPVEMLRKRP